VQAVLVGPNFVIPEFTGRQIIEISTDTGVPSFV
jgi:hypothetical protein